MAIELAAGAGALAAGSGLLTLTIAGILTLLGTIFRNPVMQLVGGAIIIYWLAILHLIPTWLTVILAFIFIFMITKK